MERLALAGAETPASVLELLHPTGQALSIRVFGCACSADGGICPHPRYQAGGLADLVVFAPAPRELKAPGWLETALKEAADCLRRDGVMYALSPLTSRRAVLALLRARGLQVKGVYLHHPGWPDAQTLIPFERRSLTYAFSRLIRTDPGRRRIVLGALALPGVVPLVRNLLPSIGMVVQFPGAPRELAWFTDLLPAGISGVVINSSWRGPNGAVLLHAVNGAPGEPAAIAKTWLASDGERAMAREVTGLDHCAAKAAESGIRVPKLLGQGRFGEHPYLVESAVTGEKASAVLQNQPERLEDLLSRLVGWMTAWNLATSQSRILSRELLEEILIRPAQELVADLREDGHYLAALAALADRLVGQSMPFVQVHGDLTMVNVLVDRNLQLGVIDWETARPAFLPMADFVYAAVDAVAAIDDYRDRPAAYAACFIRRGRYADLIGRLQAQLAEKLRLTADEVTLCSHAAWINFALAERRENAKAVPDEFLQIVRQAAAALSEHEAAIPGLHPL
jgi:hypothetical protein